VFLLARGHRGVLAGLGRFRDRAIATAGRWIARLVLVVVVVELGGGTHGALAAMACGSVVELVLCRRAARPPLLRASGFPLGAMAGYLIPIGMHAIALRLFERMDLFFLTLLGGTASDAGHYGAAQNLSLLAPLVGISVAPVFLSSLTRLWAEGDHASGCALARAAIESMLLVVPLMALVSAVSPGLVAWLYGPGFEPAAETLAWLAMGAAAQTLGGLATNVLVAGGAPRLCVLVGPVILVAAACAHPVAIPAGGATGAAIVTVSCSGLGLAIGLLLVHRRHGVLPRASHVVRALSLAGAVFAAARWWEPRGWYVPLALAVGAVLILAAAVILRMVRPRDVRAAAASLVPSPPSSRSSDRSDSRASLRGPFGGQGRPPKSDAAERGSQTR
jgi:O-antigen/teichoic acid export membrane protein